MHNNNNRFISLRKKQVDKQINTRILKKSLEKIEDKATVKIIDLDKYDISDDIKKYYENNNNVIRIK